MMKNNEKKKGNPAKKIIPAAGMLALSASMLATSTYAWFTMNKEVSVKGMEVKAQAEDGLLINEVKLISSNTWDDEAQATASPTAIALRPASTSNLTNWWHANSKKSSTEAGVGSDADLQNTVDVASGKKYKDISPNSISNNTIIDNEDASSGDKATGGTQAETHVYYSDAALGKTTGYENGEGFYVKYTYYLKSSGSTDMTVDDLEAQVKATLKTEANSAVTDLDKSLRVGIEVPASNAANAARAGFGIFAPISGADVTYNVTSADTGASSDSVTPVVADTTSQFTAATKLNIAKAGGVEDITVPNTTNSGGGLPVNVYIWFEGEDTNCKSDNLTAVLSSYDIDIKFSYPKLAT